MSQNEIRRISIIAGFILQHPFELLLFFKKFPQKYKIYLDNYRFIEYN